MKRVRNRKEDFPCIDHPFEGNMYHVWHLERLCADGRIAAISIRIPGHVRGNKMRTLVRREMSADRLRDARHQLREYVEQAGGLMPCI
ncbi:hypothetical protein CTA21_16370 [Salmonella enterica]|nr:hypothetical protein [Salmonella enterica]